MSNTLQKQIEQDLIDALKAKEEDKVNVLRFLKSALQNKAIDVKAQELTDEQVGEVVASEAKKRKESIAEFKKGGREDLANQEEKELEVLKKYLPEQMGEEEIVQIIDSAISETGASSPQDMGKVMAKVMPQVKGKADGGLVSKLVNEKLNKWAP